MPHSAKAYQLSLLDSPAFLFLPSLYISLAILALCSHSTLYFAAVYSLPSVLAAQDDMRYRLPACPVEQCRNVSNRIAITRHGVGAQNDMSVPTLIREHILPQ
ncbi:hypothetical protein FOXB_16884 [Fusarium oxysporum f. sp. conglutinans Fo5176]|uniref:Uncharacterized protein n=1 Tax=Fusarium oxysporum (strain Fo5176) TaxID=660025 RepID=F9GE00_FUSOF|nr:hypothetical protein FOXB_16884 [Fusarium oxysporum f. sp. conglutinans Fo5176]